MNTRLIPMWRYLWILWITLGVHTAAAAQRPRLVVLIAVDQLRADYLTRFEPLFARGGLRYFMDKGAYFPNARTAHALNLTSVGHAAMVTGALPYLHGITANYWYDRKNARKHYAAYDPDVKAVGSEGVLPAEVAGRSPRALLVTTLGDELKNATGGTAKVVSIALKDRAAVLMGGHRADLALWYSEAPRHWEPSKPARAQWITSTYYRPDGTLPAWVKRWNEFDYIAKHVPKTWTLLLPKAAYPMSGAMPAEAVGEGRGLGREFPHPIEGNVGAFLISPWGNDYVLATALEAVKATGLGADSTPDFLALGLSGFDLLGHTYGPLAAETQDAALRLDRSLAAFMDRLAAAVPGGRSGIVFALAADHGAQTNPEFARVSRLPGGVYWEKDFLEKANDELRARHGFSPSERPVAALVETNFFLDRELIRKKDKDPADVARSLAAWLRTEPLVAAAHPLTDLLEGRAPPTPVAAKLSVSVHPERSGDVVFASRPGYAHVDQGVKSGTGHESPSAHDAAVAMALAGAPIKPGRHHDEVSLGDLASTLSAVLGIIPPSASEGRVLGKALR